MSKISFRPRGGMEGIEATQIEQARFASFVGNKYIDEVVPLPGVSPGDQKARLGHCLKNHDRMEGAVYFENDKGNHGWCCGFCGAVVQWG